MANIPYGSDITFVDWAHGFVDGTPRMNLYQVDGSTYLVTDASFPTGTAIDIGNGTSNDPYSGTNAFASAAFYQGSNQFNDGKPAAFPGLKSNQFTYSIWIKYLNTDWSTYNNASENGIFGMQPHYSGNTAINTRGCYTMGFYKSNETVVKIYYFNVFSESYNLANYTLPNSSTKRSWHHYAVTNDKSKIYFFVDGKLIYSEAITVDPGYFGFRFLRHYNEHIYVNDYYIMKDVCLWTEDFEVPDMSLYQKYAMTNTGGSGWVPPQPPKPAPIVTNILKVY